MKSSPRNILICGMHRSGTSLTGNFFEQLGYDFGPQKELVPARPSNQDGFWERRDIIYLNDKILSMYGSSWDFPIHTNPEIIRSIAIRNMYQFADTAHTIISTLRPPFAIKDPRLSLLVPFWREIIPNAHMMIVVRNPLEVANSLHQRQNNSIIFGLQLWKSYYQCILSYTHASERFFIFHDYLINANETFIEKISNHLNICSTKEVKNAIAKAVKPSLVNHRGAPDPELVLKSNHHRSLITLWKEMRNEAGLS
jgi:hypothetical protein